MAADVTTLVRILNNFKNKNDRTVLNDSAGPKSTVTLMTRDLLGTGCCGGGSDQSLELDLDLKVPNGWEKRLDLKSGKVYLHQNDSTKSSSTRNHHLQADQSPASLQDLNFPPMISKSPASKPLLSLFDDTSLELNLFPSSSSSSSLSSSSLSVSSTNSSVCTLDKVKSALERAEKEPSRKRNSPENSVCDGNAAFSSFSSPVAVGCSGCLSYVLVMKNNPKCPRCQSFVTLPSSVKKPKIDLNMSI